MAGVYLDAETTNDALKAKRALAQSDRRPQRDATAAVLPSRLGAAGLTIEQTAAPAGAVRDNPSSSVRAPCRAWGRTGESSNPGEQVSPRMLLADFAAAAVLIVPFLYRC